MSGPTPLRPVRNDRQFDLKLVNIFKPAEIQHVCAGSHISLPFSSKIPSPPQSIRDKNAMQSHYQFMLISIAARARLGHRSPACDLTCCACQQAFLKKENKN